MLFTMYEPLTATDPIPLSSTADDALNEFQMSVVDPPYGTEVGAAMSAHAGGFGSSFTTTCVSHVMVVPLVPRTVSVNVLFCVMFENVCEPLSATPPIPWLRLAEFAFVVVHVTTVDPPFSTDVGFALSVQLGPFCVVTVTGAWHVAV